MECKYEITPSELISIVFENSNGVISVKWQLNCPLAIVRKCTFAVINIWQIDRKPSGHAASVLSNTLCYQ